MSGNSAAPARWTGSARVPGPQGYIDIGIFLAVVKVSDERLEMRSRPTLVRRMFRLDNLDVRPQDGVTIYPAHKLGQQGVEIRIPDSPPYYFWLRNRQQLMDALSAAGFSVSDVEQKYGSR
jgi:hypothetical protein